MDGSSPFTTFAGIPFPISFSDSLLRSPFSPSISFRHRRLHSDPDLRRPIRSRPLRRLSLLHGSLQLPVSNSFEDLLPSFFLLPSPSAISVSALSAKIPRSFFLRLRRLQPPISDQALSCSRSATATVTPVFVHRSAFAGDTTARSRLQFKPPSIASLAGNLNTIQIHFTGIASERERDPG